MHEGMTGAAPAARGSIERGLQQAQLVLLGLFLFSLPLLEAPKNIAVALYLAVWCLRAGLTGQLGGRWDRFDTAFAAVFASAAASALLGYRDDLSGVFRVVAMAWAVKRSDLPVRHARMLVGITCASTAIGLAVGLKWLVDGERPFLELPSVGHTNQSALYLTILVIAVFGWWRQGPVMWPSAWGRRALLASGLLFMLALLVSTSRAAMAAAIAGMVLLALAVRASGRPLRLGRLLGVTVLGIGLLGGLLWGIARFAPEFGEGKAEHLVTVASGAHRMKHWNLAIEGWRAHPWFGLGPEAFQQLTVEGACAAVTARGEACDPGNYAPATHAHSLYFATLVERGLVGLAALAFLLACWGRSLVRGLPVATTSPWWVLGAASFIVVVIGGLFNTTLRVEHGSLALLGLGLWLGSQRQQPAAIRDES